MKIGFLGPCTEYTFDVAAELGFDSVELQAGPGSTLDPRTTSDDDVHSILKLAEQKNITISAIAHYTNHLDPDEDKRRETAEYFTELLKLGGKMKVDAVCTFAGGLPDTRLEESVAVFKEVFTEHVKTAEAAGVKIAFENCRGAGNIAVTPRGWDAMFSALPSSVLGIEFDPSHLTFQFIDPVQVIYDFADRIYHVHAKDTEILNRRLYKTGVYGSGWWRFRIPGFGDVNWNKVIGALYAAGYDGGIDIEHEDFVFGFGEYLKQRSTPWPDKYIQGLKAGQRYLSTLVV